MSYVLADLITAIRDELGCVSTSELSDAQITSAIDCASRVYSKANPLLENIQVTVPESGMVTAADDVVIIMASSYSHRASNNFASHGGDLLGFGYSGSPGSSLGAGSNDTVSAIDINKRAMDIWYNEYVSDRASDMVPLEVRLVGAVYEFNPAPSTPEEGVFLRVGKLHTFETFPNRHYEVLKEGAAWRAGRMLALSRHKFISTDIGGQKMNFRNTDNLLKYFDEKWKSWMAALGQMRHIELAGG